MALITFQGKSYECKDNETVLECLERHGVLLPSACRGGVCQTCLTRAIRGKPPASAQQGLKDTLKVQNYFLACICRPEEDLTLGQADESPLYHAQVTSLERLRPHILRIRMAKPEGFTYQAGQFINLRHPREDLTRSYSLASLPEEEFLELHIKRIPNGRMSEWLFNDLACGDVLSFFGPAGDCFYVPIELEKPMLLVGTGTGLAPLYGIARQALQVGHRGDIYFYHASVDRNGLYLIDELNTLAARYSRFHYLPCVLQGNPPDGGMQGDIRDIPFAAHPSMQAFRIYLCGDPEVVDTIRRRCLQAGARPEDLHSDPFVLSPVES